MTDVELRAALADLRDVPREDLVEDWLSWIRMGRSHFGRAEEGYIMELAVFALERFWEECGEIEAGSTPDPRYLSCVWLLPSGQGSHWDVPEGQVDQVSDLVRSEMEGALDIEVPLKVDLGAGKNWEEIT